MKFWRCCSSIWKIAQCCPEIIPSPCYNNIVICIYYIHTHTHTVLYYIVIMKCPPNLNLKPWFGTELLDLFLLEALPQRVFPYTNAKGPPPLPWLKTQWRSSPLGRWFSLIFQVALKSDLRLVYGLVYGWYFAMGHVMSCYISCENMWKTVCFEPRS